MESKISKYGQAIFVVLLFIVYELAVSLYKAPEKHNDYIDEIEFRRRVDSIVGAKDKKIAILEHKVNERDSLLFGLALIETTRRDGVFTSLEDRFEGATDSTKERLINEALNDILDEE